MKEKFYLTTAIAYTSRKPHIGNTYEVVFADAIARYLRLRGKDVFFLTGTDEHGVKIQEYAEKAGIAPKEYVDRVAAEVKEVWDLMGSSYDKFIRTTDDYHEKAVSAIFDRLYEKAIFIRVNTRAGTARLAKPSIPIPRSQTAFAPIAARL